MVGGDVLSRLNVIPAKAGTTSALPQDESMSPETLQVLLPLTFLGICCLVGEILVQCHRDRSPAAAWPRPMGKTTRREKRKPLEVRRARESRL